MRVCVLLMLLALPAFALDDQVGGGSGGGPCADMLDPAAPVEFENIALFNPCMTKGFRVVRTACQLYLAVESDCLLAVWLDPGPPPRGAHDLPSLPPGLAEVATQREATLGPWRVYDVRGRESPAAEVSGVYFVILEDGRVEKRIIIEGVTVGTKTYR